MEQNALSEPQAIASEVAPIQAYESAQLLPYVRRLEEHICQLQLHVSGMHCARCIWAIESALQKQPDVTMARVNLSTARLTIEWRGEAERADALAKVVESLGYKTTPIASAEKQNQSEETALLRAMAVAGFAMGNIMLVSVALWSSSGDVMGLAVRELMHWISALIALPAIAYAGRPFFRSAYAVLSHGRTNMDVPISLALLLATGMSVHETIVGGEHAYFDSAVMLMFFLLIGRWLDARARGKARSHAAELLEMLKGTATLVQEGKANKTILISDLNADDVVRVAAGDKVPTDVQVLEGASEIDTSLVTGESLPRAARVGDKLFGGTINLNSPLICRVLQASEDSLLADIVRLMEQAEQGRSAYVRLADRVARLYTPLVHTLAAGAFAYWYVIAGATWQHSLLIAITTLIITCPCALGLAVPVVQVLAVEWLMKRGILVKSGDALERLCAVTVAVFDKTGTLTSGNLSADLSALSESQKQLAASMADASSHPLSRAISAAFDGTRIPLDEVYEVSGEGIRARCEGRSVFLGKADEISDGDDVTVSVLREEGQSEVWIRFHDTLREGAQQTVQSLHAMGIRSALLSGDRPRIAEAMAQQLGINQVKGGVLPDAKLHAIKEMQQRGEKVLMIGDGLNDAPALAQADISISPASGVDITQNTADMVFQKSSLLAVANAVRLSRLATRLVRHNFALAALYNVLAIPVAVMGFVTPLVAAIAMSSSSLLVIANSFRIRRLKEERFE